MNKTTNKYTSEVRERAVRMVLNGEGQHDSRWSAIPSISAKIGCAPQTLNEWVKKVEIDTGQRGGVTTEMAEKMKALERENIIPFMYLGAKHMVTGYDHILFLLGVVFFLYRMKEVGIYVSLFALGHSTTMLAGVWFGWGINAYIIDAIIGLSVVYKALDNLGAYQRWFGFQPNTKAATLIFGFFHGTGLATKILDYEIASEGLLANLLAFNVGVELGQLMALAVILIVMGYWRKSPNFFRQAYTANVVMMSMGFILMGLQITGYFVAA